MVSTEHTSDPYDYMQAARKENEKTDNIVASIVVFVFVVVASFSIGHLIGSCSMQEDFREEICRDMPTTADYFTCKATRDFHGKYMLVKRVDK